VGGVASEAALASAQFNSALLSLRLRSLSNDLPALAITSAISPINWNFALLCASALTSDDSEAAQIAVLRVASGCLSDADTTPNQRLAATALLERDGNGPAVRLAERKGLVGVDAWPELPMAMQLEVVKSKLRHSVPLSTGEILPVNSFQSDLWGDASSFRWLSVSAPTSSGKSRILREWFLENLRTNDQYSAVYLVPTRALVEEVSSAFREKVTSKTSVFMMPWDSTVHTAPNRVLVLTQERLHLIQTTHPHFVVDLLFVDEAQGLGGAQRGILLQQVIDRTVAANPDAQVIFASPLSANPELLLEGHPREALTSSFTSETVTVNQNILRVEPIPNTRASKAVSLVHGGRPDRIGEVLLPTRPSGVFKTLAAIAYTMGREHGGNIIYANRPDDAEKIASALQKLVGSHRPPLDPEIAELQSLIKTAVHPNYALIEALSYGVAFHYGNMPLAIRAEIERLFEEEKIGFLVCTSTLLEGVNLPCKNIFIRSPRKGSGNPMTELDFWNLAGRAGRWGKEFQGNVICIDTQDRAGWPILPTVRGRFALKRAVPSGLKNPHELLTYLSTAKLLVVANPEGENLFSYLAARFVNGSDLRGELSSVANAAIRDRVRQEIEQSVTTASFPLELIPRHAGISPIAMTKLLDNFRASGLPASALALPKPDHPHAKARYQDAFVRLGDTMTLAFGIRPTTGDDRRKWQIAALVKNWMRGMPLSRLIEQRVSDKIHLSKAIRDVMRDIETVVRFQSAKYLACYNDILAVYAGERGETTEAQFDVTMMLELGVSRPSQVALMSLGLSRTATIAVSDLIESDEWSTIEALAWLRSTNFDSVDIPKALKREIVKLLEATRN
jgi:hypothetical protein